MSKLEDFIKKNRQQFDHRAPGKNVWSQIEFALYGSASPSLWNTLWVWRAAALVFFALSVWLMVSAPWQPPTTGLANRAIQREFSAEETFYREQIAEKVALIDGIQEGFQDERFEQDFKKLDAMYQVLREQMKASPSEKVREALILNMLVRIDLLNQQIKKLEDIKRKEPAEEKEI